MKINQKQLGIFSLIAGLLILSLSTCDDYKKITYEPSDFFLTACDNLNDSLATIKQPRSLVSFGDSTWVDSTVSEITGVLLDSLENLPESSMISAPLDSLIGLNPSQTDTGYISLHVTPDTWVMMFNNYIQFHLFTDQGDMVQPQSQSILPEEVLACDTLKVKNEYNLTESRYLFQFIRTNKTVEDTVGNVVNFWMTPKEQ